MEKKWRSKVRPVSPRLTLDIWTPVERHRLDTKSGGGYHAVILFSESQSFAEWLLNIGARPLLYGSVPISQSLG